MTSTKAFMMTAGFAAVLLGVLFYSAKSYGQIIPKTLDRHEDIVIVKGEQMPGLAHAPLPQLFVYAFRQNQWHQIPWQFDEVRDTTYYAADNGILDLEDELVVMAGDCGDRPSAKEWISDTDSKSYIRYEITITDPLDPAKQAWLYVYRSKTLTDTVKTDYVDYANNLFTAAAYKLHFMLEYIAGDVLELNGSGIDVLDRSKYRIKSPGLDENDEEWMEGEDPQPEILDGRVRAIAGYQNIGILGRGLLTFGYRSMFYDLIIIDLLWAPGSIEWARASADFNENIIGATYYDANTPQGVTVDGVPDTIKTTPAVLWQQISASTGTIIHTADVTPMQGTLSMYYRDDAAYDRKDTGDHKSYGDMGVVVTNPIKYIYLSVTHYILPPEQPNVGARYYDYYTHPLRTQATLSSISNTNEQTAPNSFGLSCNYPNPFNANTVLPYQISEAAQVEIAVYDVSGRKIQILLNERRTPGSYAVLWNGLDEMGRAVASGIYLGVLRTGSVQKIQRMLLLR